MFVNDLVRSKAMGVGCGNIETETEEASPTSQATTASSERIKSLRKREKFIPIANPNKMKKIYCLHQSSSANGNGRNEVDYAQRSPVDLHCIKKVIKHHSPQYNFLEDVLDGLTEEISYKYDAAAKKRRRYEAKPVSKNATIESSVEVQKFQYGGNGSDLFPGGCKDEVTLNQAILYAQQASERGRDAIVADDDDYD